VTPEIRVGNRMGASARGAFKNWNALEVNRS
jgi:hypothetical protein